MTCASAATDLETAAPRVLTSGILIMDKPAGWTSHDVVARVRRITGGSRVGHAGTLDPAATGLLILCVGAATRIVEYLDGLHKAYEASVLFGVETDTWDGAGTVVATSDTCSLTLDALEDILPRFTGEIYQVPPMYSALKRAGTPLYRLARKGQTVEREPRAVTIYTLAVRAWEPPRLDLTISCSSGTYVRSLAHDLGQAVGTGASLSSLRRTAIGPYSLADAITPDGLAAVDDWRTCLRPTIEALQHLPCALVDVAAAEEIRFGRAVSLPGAGPAARLCAVDETGQLVAMLRHDDATDLWRPMKVFPGEGTE